MPSVGFICKTADLTAGDCTLAKAANKSTCTLRCLKNGLLARAANSTRNGTVYCILLYKNGEKDTLVL